jgi:broad specificity phosphatase PhoE
MEAHVATTFFLVRHGAHALVDRVLLGCTREVFLDERGYRQAQALAERFASERVDAIHSSPRERTLQTAQPIAERLGIPVEIEAALDEIDCGDWSGRGFDELRSRADWQEWNRSRSTARPPGGESMAEVQQRILAHLGRMHSARPNGRFVLVSHCDVIRAAILHYMGRSLDDYDAIDLAPGAVIELELTGEAGTARAVNMMVPT